MTDLLLAIVHHVAILMVIVLLAMEFALLRPGLDGTALKRLAGLDAVYGASAGLVLLVGIARVVWGIKGADFYLGNPWFWGKMAAFVLIGLLSVPPTIAILRWRRAQKADPSFLPPDADIRKLRPLVHAEVALLLVVVIAAAAMARQGSF
jgi:putative membrane protein